MAKAEKGKKDTAAGKAKKPAVTKITAKKTAKTVSTAKSAAKTKKAATAAGSKKSTAPVTLKAKGKAGARKIPALPHLNEKVLGQIIAKLEDLREESVRMVNMHMQEDLKQREESGEVGDDMDQASNERDREFSLIIHQRHLRRLKQVDDAFERIEDGSYGLCEGTEELIDPKRLLIMPLARFSIEYQQQQEKLLGRSPDDGIGMSDETMISDE